MYLTCGMFFDVEQIHVKISLYRVPSVQHQLRNRLAYHVRGGLVQQQLLAAAALFWQRGNYQVFHVPGTWNALTP